MTLEAGTKIGAFEITERISAGGMGEVWRARDTNLKASTRVDDDDGNPDRLRFAVDEFQVVLNFLAAFQRRVGE